MKILFSYLKDAVTTEPEAQPKLSRTSQRQAHCARLVGEGLPDGRALTVDISELGLCIETFEPIEKGTQLDLKLEVGHFPLALKSEVKWCEKISDTIYRLGLSLESSAPRTQHALYLYLRRL